MLKVEHKKDGKVELKQMSIKPNLGFEIRWSSKKYYYGVNVFEEEDFIAN